MDCHSKTVLSLCSGAGGLELGLKLAVPETRTVCYVEGEAYAAAQLAARMEDETMDAAPIWSNVKTFDPKPWRGCVDIITAGYPCQPFSIAGAKRAEKDPRHLWPYIREIVRTIEPGICFFENVSHHLRLGFEQVHDDLRSMGYSVAAGLFTAEEVGAPHKRERLFILAYRDGDRLICEQGALARKNDPQGWEECSAHTIAGGNGDAARGLPLHETGSAISKSGQRLQNSKSKLADAARSGLERHAEHETQKDGPNISFGDSLQLWPPSPGDTKTWGSVPDALKPAIHRMADGMAYRVDRVRACGNGVVPLVAAYAFRTLITAIDRTS